MKKTVLLIIICSVLTQVQSQELFFGTGRNFTTYDYKNSNNEVNPNIQGSSGSFYELGYALPLENISPNIKYAVSLTLNQFNATGGTNVDYYNWNTNYLGLQNTIKYNLLGNRSSFAINLLAAFNINSLISGEQKINGQTFKLKDSDEFKGIFIQPILGVTVAYFITSDFSAGFGYNLSKSFGISNNSDQKLNFKNNQLQFILNYYLN